MPLLLNLEQRLAGMDPALIGQDPQTQPGVPYGNDATPTPIPTKPDIIIREDPGLQTIIPDRGLDTSPTRTTNNTGSISPLQQFNQLLFSPSAATIPNDLKIQMTELAKSAAVGDYNPQNIKALHQAIFNSGLPQDIKVQLSNMITYQAAAPKPTPTSPSGGGGGGGGSTGGGGGGGGGEGGGGGAGTYSTANTLLNALMGGDFSSLPLWAELTDPARNDPYSNPAMQSIVDSIQREAQEDWLGNVTQLTEAAEAGGRYGSGTYNALRTRETEEANEAVFDAISRLLGGAYESEQSRRTSLLQSAMDAMLGSAGLAYSDKASARQASAAAAANRLAGQQFNFSKKMQLAAGQQDALSDFLGTILGIGSLGGTTYGVSPGTYQPSMDPTAALLLGGWGGYVQGRGLQGGSGSGTGTASGSVGGR